MTDVDPDLRVLCVNDVYKPERLSQLKSIVDRRKHPRCINKLVLPGDFLGGSSFAAKHRGESVVEVLNELSVDYFTQGNHEFDYGAERVMELMDKSNFLWLGSNVRHADSGTLFHKTVDTDIFELQTSSAGVVQVGVFGVCTQLTPDLSHPGNSVIFEDVINHARRCTKFLRDSGCEVVIALTHAELATDRNIAEIPGVNVIIGGHEHTPYLLAHRETLIVKCGQNVDYLGVMDLKLERDGNGIVQVIPSFQLLSTHGAPSDAGIDAVIARWQNISDPNDEALCYIGDTALSTRTADCRGRETAFACMAADALKYSYREEGCQLGIQNGGFIRNDNLYPAGSQLMKSHVLDEMPFPRKAALLRMKGKDIKLGIEQMIRGCPEPVGSFPHLSSGWRAEYDLSRSPMDRIISITYKSKPINLERSYLVAIQDFYIECDGDGVDVYPSMEVVALHGKLVSQCVIEYLKKAKVVSGVPPKRFITKDDLIDQGRDYETEMAQMMLSPRPMSSGAVDSHDHALSDELPAA